MVPNRVPEKRVGLALILIGAFSLVLYVVNSATTGSPDALAFFAIMTMLLVGFGLRRRFKEWEAPPPPKAAPRPPAPAAPKPKGSLLSLPFGGRKPAPPPPAAPKPAAPPTPAKPRGILGRLDQAMKPKNKK